MRILVLKNTPLDIDFNPVLSFFKARGIIFNLTFKNIVVPNKIRLIKSVEGFNPTTGVKGTVGYYGLSPQPIPDVSYDGTIFVWDMDSIPQPKNGGITSWSHPSGSMEIAVNKYLKDRDLITHRITHELMHFLCFYLKKKGVDVLDEMDITSDNKPFYKNDQPNANDGNYAKTFANITPYMPLLTQNTTPQPPTPKKWIYFTPKEVEGLKTELVDKLDKARDLAGIPFKLTSTLRDPAKNEAVGGVQNSAHILGEAVDIACTHGNARWQIVNALLMVGFNRIGIGKDFIHADISKTLPQKVIFTYYK